MSDVENRCGTIKCFFSYLSILIPLTEDNKTTCQVTSLTICMDVCYWQVLLKLYVMLLVRKLILWLCFFVTEKYPRHLCWWEGESVEVSRSLMQKLLPCPCLCLLFFVIFFSFSFLICYVLLYLLTLVMLIIKNPAICYLRVPWYLIKKWWIHILNHSSPFLWKIFKASPVIGSTQSNVQLRIYYFLTYNQ